jgi:hypothetical protein
MKKIFDKANQNPYWVFVVSIYSFKDTITFNNTGNCMLLYNHNFDLIAFLLNTGIAFLLFLLIRKYNHIKKEMKVFTVVSYIRNRMLFIHSYKDSQFFVNPDSTIDDNIWKGLPEGGLLTDHLNKEFQLSRKVLQKELDYLSVKEIDEMIIKYYPEKNMIKL